MEWQSKTTQGLIPHRGDQLICACPPARLSIDRPATSGDPMSIRQLSIWSLSLGLGFLATSALAACRQYRWSGNCSSPRCLTCESLAVGPTCSVTSAFIKCSAADGPTTELFGKVRKSQNGWWDESSVHIDTANGCGTVEYHPSTCIAIDGACRCPAEPDMGWEPSQDPCPLKTGGEYCQ